MSSSGRSTAATSDPAAGTAMTRRRLPISNDVGPLLPSNGAEAHLSAARTIGHELPLRDLIGATFRDLISEHAARHRAGERHF